MRPKVPPASTRDQRAVGGQTDRIICRYYTVTGRRAHFSSLLRRLSTEKVVLWYESEASGVTLARTVFSPVATARSLPHYNAPSPSLPPTPFSLPLRSEIKSVIQQNNLKSFGVGEGEGFLFSLVCATPPSPARQLRPADLLPLSIVCPADCVLPARGVEAGLCLRCPILNPPSVSVRCNKFHLVRVGRAARRKIHIFLFVDEHSIY